MSDEDKRIEIQNMMQEMRGLEQISKILSVGGDMSESNMDDIWYVVYTMLHKWRNILSDAVCEEKKTRES
mgnify:CR=1 FL=1